MTSSSMEQTPPRDRALLIDDAGPAALVAALLEPEPARVRLWCVRGVGAPSRRLDASRRRAELLGLEGVDVAGTPSPNADERTVGIESARTLLAAAARAVETDRTRVVWPAALGDDLSQMAAAADRVRAVERLLDLETDPTRAPIRFDLPLLDLTLDQVADLAIDLDAPGEGAWWCEHNGKAPCGACSACESWQAALQRARFGCAGTAGQRA